MAAEVAEQVTHARRSPVSARDLILEAKITTPRVPRWAVRRARITKLIARGTQWFPLTVITGPPGAGKTMAAALWAAEEPGPVSWVSLDKYDNRPGAFWSYVVAALRRSGVPVPGTPDVTQRGRVAEHTFLLRLASALAGHPSVTLVLDDLHLLTDPKLLDGLDFVLRNSGSGLRLVVCSRMDPLLPLHRYRLAGHLAEIRASDLAFSTAEAGLLLSQHGCQLSQDALACLTRRTEGWAAGLRLAAMSMDTHPDPAIFLKDLMGEDSALTGYLVKEVLNAQPPEVQEVLLSTSILDQVNAEAATELAGSERAAAIMLALAHANTFVESIGGGWYRYHPLFSEMLRLTLRHEYPDRIAFLHQRAARWYERNGQLTDAVRHAAQAGDWQLAASIVIDGLAISGLLMPDATKSLAEEFQAMPDDEAWLAPEPYLVSAAVTLSAGRPGPSARALDAAEGILEGFPADEKAACRLAAALIRLAAARRTRDLTAATAAADRAEMLVSRVSADTLARHPAIRAFVLAGRGAVELWSGRFDEAAGVLESGLAAATASGAADERADCLGQLAMAEALRGRLRRAAELAAQATTIAAGERQVRTRRPNPAGLVAHAWVHLGHNELREARSRLKQAEAALAASPDKLTGAVACLAAAQAGLAAGRADLTGQFVARARSGWSVPAWLDQMLTLAEVRACVAAGDTQAALAAAGRAGRDNSLAASVTLAQAWAAAGDTSNARRALAPALAVHCEAPDAVLLQAWLVDAKLSYRSGDDARGHRSLASALRLAQCEQLRQPFTLERDWIGPALRHDPELAHAYRRLFVPAPHGDQLSKQPGVPDQAATPVVVESLSERELEVLRHLSRMLNTAEIASEMYLSANTVKTHVKNILRKLAAPRRGEAVRRARQLQLI